MTGALAPDPGKPPRPPGCRPPADDAWLFGAAHNAPRGQEGDPCGSGPVTPDRSDEKDGAGT